MQSFEATDAESCRQLIALRLRAGPCDRREADRILVDLRDRHVELVATVQDRECPDRVVVARHPDRYLDPQARTDDRMVLDAVLRELLVGDDDARAIVGPYVRVGEADVLDRAGRALEGHEVADPDRLRDRQQYAGHGIREGLARREPDHETEHRGRGEYPGSHSLRRRELAQ